MRFLFSIVRGRSSNKAGFGIVEVLVSIVVLGFLYAALNKLQLGNHEAFLRIRGRDGAVEVAQQVLDQLKSNGIAAIPSDELQETTVPMVSITKSWERGLGGNATVEYRPTIVVSPTGPYTIENVTALGTTKRVYAKQVNVKVEWDFKGSTQSINVSGVIR